MAVGRDQFWVGRKTDGPGVTLRLVGPVNLSTMNAVALECDKWKDEGRVVALDLSKVTSLNRGGAESLIRLHCFGVRLREAPLHVALYLKLRGLSGELIVTDKRSKGKARGVRRR